jgi:hypothetical protein
MDMSILQKWLKSGYLEKQVFYDTVSGTPQGGIISPVLANLALDGLELRLREAFPRYGKGSDLYGPAVCCKGKPLNGGRLVLHQCIRSICGAFAMLPTIMDMSAHSI